MFSLVTTLRTRIGRWLAQGSCDVHEVRGFRVVVENSRPDIETSAVLARLDEALALLEELEPRRMRHLRRDLLQFWIVRYPCRGAYFPDTRSCLTELTFLARRDISAAVVASSILHEGVHARVAGFRARVGGSSSEENRAREERLCRRAELAFGRALPSELGGPVIERAEASLAMDDTSVAPNIDWNLAKARIEQADRG
ncbi:MAG: hypothetical protein JWO05_927 [Gemmatimonadetes bacterium]|nr:hypothetical protein [Gemmatimonadota bacterium]